MHGIGGGGGGHEGQNKTLKGMVNGQVFPAVFLPRAGC